MKVRAILKSLLFSYALTGVALLFLAFVLFAFELGETAVDAGIIVIYVLACFMGGFMAGKIVRKDLSLIHIFIRNFDAELFTDIFVIFFCEIWCIFDRHCGNIFTVF